MTAATSDAAALERVAFSDLPRCAPADCGEAFEVFRRSAAAASAGTAPLRAAQPVDAVLAAAFARALALGPAPSSAMATAFFRDTFTPHRLGEQAFFTGYYEPVVEGALTPGAGFAAPLLRRPDDLVTFATDEPRPPALAGLSAARLGPDGWLSPYPARAEIEAAIGGGALHPIVWLRDWVEVFFIHVQGSCRVRLPDGRMLRATYAGRNGHPYTSIGRVLADSGAMTPEAASLDGLKAWICAHGQAPGEAGRALMQRNASYIFFSAAIDTAGTGPTGGAGVPLTALRSIAVDRTRWAYGLPFVVDTAVPWEGATPTPFRRLMIAQDTGAAIVGPARVDLYMGSGEAAGRRAGGVRHHGRLTVLLPREP